jgi:hypothetical protein
MSKAAARSRQRRRAAALRAVHGERVTAKSFRPRGSDRHAADDYDLAAVAGRRAGAPVAARAEVVAPLARCGLPVAQALGAGVECPGEPVGEGARGGVGVVDHERERARALRRARPGERGREILPHAAVPARDRTAMIEGTAVKREVRHPRKDDRIATPTFRGQAGRGVRGCGRRSRETRVPRSQPARPR